MTRTPALIALVLLAVPAAAQDPYADYNRNRAYAHYLNSQSPVKTYSSLQPGRAWGYETPWESTQYRQSPGYYREESTPWGHTVYDRPPVVSRYVEQRFPAPAYYPSYDYPVPAYPVPAYPYR
jgi:hypothetical protein